MLCELNLRDLWRWVPQEWVTQLRIRLWSALVIFSFGCLNISDYMKFDIIIINLWKNFILYSTVQKSSKTSSTAVADIVRYPWASTTWQEYRNSLIHWWKFLTLCFLFSVVRSMSAYMGTSLSLFFLYLRYTQVPRLCGNSIFPGHRTFLGKYKLFVNPRISYI